MQWSVWFMWCFLWSGFALIITFATLIGNYIIEYQYEFPYYVTPYFWSVCFVEFGCGVASILSSIVLSETRL